MKMTLHIDAALLARVMKARDFETKTEAIHFALNELDRKARLRAMMEEGLGASPEELADAVFDGYDPINMRLGNPAGWKGGESARVAEDPPPYGKKRPD